MNKQTGAKKAEAYFTGIINILIEANAEGLPCDCDPRELTSVTRDGLFKLEPEVTEFVRKAYEQRNAR
jgi:hypothetical protein